jgi:hypothetical protein
VATEGWDEEAARIGGNQLVSCARRCRHPERDVEFVEAVALGVDELGERPPPRTNQVGAPWVSPSVTSGSAAHSFRTPASRSSVVGEVFMCSLPALLRRGLNNRPAH